MTNLNSIKNSIVLVRVCFDLPDLKHLNRVEDSIETIKTLLQNNNKVVLLSHWGRPKGTINLNYSFQKALKILQSKIEFYLNKKGFEFQSGIEFIDQSENTDLDFSLIKNYILKSEQKLFLLENTRFIQNEQSENKLNRFKLAENYAKIGDYFVNEAFAVSHRKEATVSELAQLLPTVYGLSFTKELKYLSKLKHSPKKPFVLVLGGAKLETKLPLLLNLIGKADYILLGGLICFPFLEQNNTTFKIHQNLIKLEFKPEIAKLLSSGKIILPIDFIYDKDGFAKDIGPETINFYSKYIQKAQTIFWNGPMGFYEDSQFRNGTISLANQIAKQTKAYRVIGGGDTTSALSKSVLAKFNFVSMGGGATLNFLT